MSISTSILREKVAQEISRLPSKGSHNVLFFVHRQADPDALCAAAGVADLIAKAFPEFIFQPTIVVPQSASFLGERICSKFNIHFVTELDFEVIQNANLVVILDTGNPHLLDPFYEHIARSQARKILIDHHSISKDQNLWQAIDACIILADSTSTCEIVTLGFADDPISARTAQILLTGLMFDSQHLGIANRNTLEAALVLVKAGADIEAAKRVLRSKPDRPETLARIKSAQRLQYVELGKYIVLRSEVSSFHASVARMLLEIGADVGVAFGKNDDETRISVRSTQAFYKETGIDLSVVLRKICSELNLVGGGHPTAASASGNQSPTITVSRIIDALAAALPNT